MQPANRPPQPPARAGLFWPWGPLGIVAVYDTVLPGLEGRAKMRTGDRADLYRSRAVALRAEAESLTDPDSKRFVLEIAERFERLAAHIEAQDKPP